MQIEWNLRARELAVDLTHERVGGVHGGGFGFAGETDEQLPPSGPHALGLNAGGNASQCRRCHRCARHRVSPESFGRLKGQLHDPLTEFGKRDSRRRRGLGNQAQLRHPRKCVRFQTVECSVRRHPEVYARAARELERREREQGLLLRRAAFRRPKSAPGNSSRAMPGRVLAFVVVNLVLRDDFPHRQGLSPSMPTVSSRPAMNCSIITSSS